MSTIETPPRSSRFRCPTLTLGIRANPPSEDPPPEPPNPQGRKQEQALVTSLDEAHAPFKYATKGSFDFKGTFTDVEDPKQLFNNSAKLIISTLQGGLHAPIIPTPNLLSATDWADLSCALLAAIGRGYSLQYDKDQAVAELKKEWSEAPDLSPLSPRYPTLFHRLSATADLLNDQLLIDGQDDESNIEGWIAEAKIAILKEETENLKAQVREDWRQWKDDQIKSLAATHERDIAEAVQKRNASYILNAAASLGLCLPPPAHTMPQLLPGPPSATLRGVKHTASGTAPSAEPTTPRKQKLNPPRDAKRLPSPSATPRGRATNHPDTGRTPSPKVTLNLGPKVTPPPTAGMGQLDANAIIAAIKAAMAPITSRLTALERAAMPPPLTRAGTYPTHDETPDRQELSASHTNAAHPMTRVEEDFTLVSRNGKGKKGKGKASAPGQGTEQQRQANVAPASYAGQQRQPLTSHSPQHNGEVATHSRPSQR
ncbi:hypothetical protein BJV77DRAFT_1067505 [Russula vinacea]|nr:hypothetical protein BJV77DRAFT_1067505 [Russula vinacea]